MAFPFRIIVFFCITVVWMVNGISLKAQTEPSPDIINTLDALDNINAVGDYSTFDSATKKSIAFGIGVCEQYLVKKTDSFARAMFLYHKGRLEFLRNEYDTARVYLENALNHDISNYLALERLCVLTFNHVPNYYMHKFYINSSIELWKQRCYYDSLNAFHWYHLAKTYQLQSNFTEANNNDKMLQSIKRSVELDSTNATYWYEYALQSNPNDKITYLFKALSLSENWNWRLDIIKWHIENSKTNMLLPFIEQSLQMYTPYAETFPFFMSELYGMKATIMQEQGNMEEYSKLKEKQNYFLKKVN